MGLAHEQSDTPPVSSEGVFEARDSRYLRHLERLRRGEPPAQEDEQEGVATTPSDTPAAEQPRDLPHDSRDLSHGTAAPASEPAPESEPLIPIAEIAPHLPDPTRPYYWFASDSVPERKLVGGRAVYEEAGTRLSDWADWWCHEGDKEWTRVDRALRPRPEVKKRKAKRKARNTNAH